VTLAENAYLSSVPGIIADVATLNAENRIIVVSLIVEVWAFVIWTHF
jgi:hypothetical protein